MWKRLYLFSLIVPFFILSACSGVENSAETQSLSGTVNPALGIISGGGGAVLGVGDNVFSVKKPVANVLTEKGTNKMSRSRVVGIKTYPSVPDVIEMGEVQLSNISSATVHIKSNYSDEPIVDIEVFGPGTVSLDIPISAINAAAGELNIPSSILAQADFAVDIEMEPQTPTGVIGDGGTGEPPDDDTPDPWPHESDCGLRCEASDYDGLQGSETETGTDSLVPLFKSGALSNPIAAKSSSTTSYYQVPCLAKVLGLDLVAPMFDRDAAGDYADTDMLRHAGVDNIVGTIDDIPTTSNGDGAFPALLHIIDNNPFCSFSIVEPIFFDNVNKVGFNMILQRLDGLAGPVNGVNDLDPINGYDLLVASNRTQPLPPTNQPIYPSEGIMDIARVAGNVDFAGGDLADALMGERDEFKPSLLLVNLETKNQTVAPTGFFEFYYEDIEPNVRAYPGIVHSETQNIYGSRFFEEGDPDGRAEVFLANTPAIDASFGLCNLGFRAIKTLLTPANPALTFNNRFKDVTRDNFLMSDGTTKFGKSPTCEFYPDLMVGGAQNINSIHYFAQDLAEIDLNNDGCQDILLGTHDPNYMVTDELGNPIPNRSEYFINTCVDANDDGIVEFHAGDDQAPLLPDFYGAVNQRPVSEIQLVEIPSRIDPSDPNCANGCPFLGEDYISNGKYGKLIVFVYSDQGGASGTEPPFEVWAQKFDETSGWNSWQRVTSSIAANLGTATAATDVEFQNINQDGSLDMIILNSQDASDNEICMGNDDADNYAVDAITPALAQNPMFNPFTQGKWSSSTLTYLQTVRDISTGDISTACNPYTLAPLFSPGDINPVSGNPFTNNFEYCKDMFNTGGTLIPALYLNSPVLDPSMPTQPTPQGYVDSQGWQHTRYLFTNENR